MSDEIIIIGGGLAGCEAAWQAAGRNCQVTLHEMKPKKFSPAHKSEFLAELVCSNSLRSSDLHSAVGLLKEEMRRTGSLIMAAAGKTSVPAGKALAVDRNRFAEYITRRIDEHPLISVSREEITEIPPPSSTPVIIATGPLTSSGLADSLLEITSRDHLAFYDAIAPIVYADSLDMGIIFQASRYDDGPGDYLNCPMDEKQYKHFITELKHAEKVPLKSFEKKKYFEGCLPIEVMLDRGDNTLRFGPMKPVGLTDPGTGKASFAVVQLRKENRENTLYNMVGFQTKLTYPEQKRVFSLIPGMEKAEFARLGSIHRNTFICSPDLLMETLQFIKRPDLLPAGQITGVEGYVESTAIGLLAGLNAARLANAESPVVPPPVTAMGALIAHLTNRDVKHFQPSNINFGLFKKLGKKIPKRFRGEHYAERALKALEKWLDTENIRRKE